MKNLRKTIALITILTMVLSLSLTAFAGEEIPSSPFRLPIVGVRPSPEPEQPAEQPEAEPELPAEEPLEVEQPEAEQSVEELPEAEQPEQPTEEQPAEEQPEEEPAEPEQSAEQPEEEPTEPEQPEEELPEAEPAVERSVTFTSDHAGEVVEIGTVITLTAHLSGFEGIEYTVFWQYTDDYGATIVDAGTGMTFSYTADETNAGRLFRVYVETAE